MKYSTISVLEYFKDTLANLVLTEAWLKFDSNCVTRVENRYVKRKSNQIGKKHVSLVKSKPQLSLIKSKPQLSLIKSKIVSRIKSKTVTSKTDDADNGAIVG